MVTDFIARNKKTKHSSNIPKDDLPEFQLSPWRRNFWFLILWFIYLLDIADRNCMASVLPLIKREFVLTDAQSGMIASIFGLTLALTALPISVLIDKWSRRKMISIMVGVWSIATFFTGHAKNFNTILIPRLFLGVGEAAYNSGAYSLLSAWFKASQRGTVLGLYNSAVTIGGALGLFLGGYIAFNYGWRYVFYVFGVPGLLFAALAWFIPDYKSKQAVAEKTGAEVKTDFLTAFKFILKTPSLLYLYLGSAAGAISYNAFTIWAPTFAVRTHELNIAEAGKYFAIMGLIAFPGAICGGYLGDFLKRYFYYGRTLASSICLFLLCIAAITAIHSKDLTTFLILWTIVLFLVVSYNSNLVACTQELVPPYFRAISYSFVPIFNQLLAGVWAPILVGAISDRYGLAPALTTIAVASPGLAIILFSLSGMYYKKCVLKLENMGKFKLEEK